MAQRMNELTMIKIKQVKRMLNEHPHIINVYKVNRCYRTKQQGKTSRALIPFVCALIPFATVCIIRDEFGRFHRGCALCSPNESFSYELGKVYAGIRALRAIKRRKIEVMHGKRFQNALAFYFSTTDINRENTDINGEDVFTIDAFFQKNYLLSSIKSNNNEQIEKLALAFFTKTYFDFPKEMLSTKENWLFERTL